LVVAQVEMFRQNIWPWPANGSDQPALDL
jgi:hypothetical protein